MAENNENENNENMQDFERIFQEMVANFEASNDVVIDLEDNEIYLGPATSTMSMLPSSYMPPTGDNSNDDDSLKVVYTKLNPAPELNVEVNHNTCEIILDFLKKDVNPYHGIYSSRCRVQTTEFGLSVSFNIGPYTFNHLVKNEEKDPSASSTAPPCRTALYCGICSQSHVQIFSSGKSLMSSVCGHIFCNVCLEENAESSEKCLTCDEKLTKKQYHFLYQ